MATKTKFELNLPEQNKFLQGLVVATSGDIKTKDVIVMELSNGGILLFTNSIMSILNMYVVATISTGDPDSCNSHPAQF